LAGAASVAAAFVGSLAFELLRSFAVDLMPDTWQIVLGSALLLTILFLPDGLGSIFSRRAGAEEAPTP
jgi:ABC-type branched-subunit amino acid transport system permease subunit